jgi:hypothetical protein
MRGEGQQNEGPSIGKEDLREVQGQQPPRGGSGDLRKRKAQAAPGLEGLAVNGNLHRSEQCSVDSEQQKRRVPAGKLTTDH